MKQNNVPLEKKYTKIHERLYHELRDDGRPFNWHKATEDLFIKLYDVQIITSFALEESETETIISKLDRLEESEKIGANKNQTLSKKDEQLIQKSRDAAVATVSTKNKDKKISRRITAKATFEDNRVVNLFSESNQDIEEKESRANLGDILYAALMDIKRKDGFSSATFTCREGDSHGYLIHMDGDILNYDDASEPYIAIETYLPEELFEALIEQITLGNEKEITVFLKVDIFQSEVERSLAEPWMLQEYTIETNSSNFCGIEWVSIGSKKHFPTPVDNNYTDTGSNEEEVDCEHDNEEPDKCDNKTNKDAVSPLFVLHEKAAYVLSFITIIPLATLLIYYLNVQVLGFQSWSILEAWIWGASVFAVFSWALIYISFVDKLFADEWVWGVAFSIKSVFLIWGSLISLILYPILSPIYALYGLIYMFGYAFNKGASK